MNLKLAFVIHLVIGISFSVVKVDGLRCYVCGDDDLPCTDFDLKKDQYIKECVSPSDKSCEKITEGNNIVWKCSESRIDDCKPANGVEYCYCITDLCNGNISKLAGPTDDEDLIEGSGTKTISTATEKPIVTKDKSNGNKADLYCTLIFVPFFNIFFNK